MEPEWADVFPIENQDIPACYASLPEAICFFFWSISLENV